jgi:hypothetical protein
MTSSRYSIFVLGCGVASVLALTACGAPEASNVPLEAPLETLPPATASTGSPDDATPLHPLNNLLLGAPTVHHLEIVAAPLVVQCMAAAEFVVELNPPETVPATYGERAAAAAAGYIPALPFSIEESLSDQYLALGDESPAEQDRFALALSGSDAIGEGAGVDYVAGCAEEARISASSPLRLSGEQLQEAHELSMSAILSPAMEAAESQFVTCVADAGFEVADSGNLTDLMEQAVRDGDRDRASEMFAINDTCAEETIDVAEAQATDSVLAELLVRGVITDTTAREVLHS